MVVYEVVDQFHEIVIAGLDAIGRARAVFVPRSYYGTGLISTHPAYVVKGTVYFMDGYGTVFRMGVDGKQVVVTKFPMQLGEQAASFAVSPDGCQLAASILTPAVGTSHWALQTMRADAGSPAEVLHTWTSVNPPNSKSPNSFKHLVLVGWDSVGPVAVVGSTTSGWFGAPSAGPVDYVANPDFVGGQVVHLAGDGRAGPAATSSTCNAAQVSPAGEITCFQPGSAGTWILTIASSTGGTEAAPIHIHVGEEHSTMGGLPCVVNFDFSSFTQCRGAYVAVGPGGLVAASWAVAVSPIAAPAAVPTAGLWRGQDGASGTLPSFFHPEGWVDSQTIFGQHTVGLDDAALVHLGGAQPTLEDLQFAGNFVGMLT
jgi:hypothetical protein